MKRKAYLTELMDEEGVEPGELARSLKCIRGVNKYLGGVSAVLGHVKKFAEGWPRGEGEAGGGVMTFLDVATGSGDIPEEIIGWARATGRRVKIIGLDLHATTLKVAREWTVGSAGELSFVRGDALQLPLGDGAVDYALCSMFLHHLTDAEAVRVVGEMVRVARRGVIVNDLLRNWPAKVFVHLMTVPAGRLEKHDARVSVAKAWTKREVMGWRGEVGADWLRYKRHLFSRFTLYGEKTGI